MKDIVFFLTGKKQPVVKANSADIIIWIAVHLESYNRNRITSEAMVRAFLAAKENLCLPLDSFVFETSTSVYRSGESLDSVILAIGVVITIVWVIVGGVIDEQTPLICSIDPG